MIVILSQYGYTIVYDIIVVTDPDSLSLWHSKYLIKSKSLRSWGRGARSTPTPLNVIVYRLKILHLPLQTHLSNLSVRLGIKSPCFGMSEIPKRQNNTEVSNPHFYSFIPLHSIQVFLSLSLNIVEVLNCSLCLRCKLYTLQLWLFVQDGYAKLTIVQISPFWYYFARIPSTSSVQYKLYFFTLIYQLFCHVVLNTFMTIILRLIHTILYFVYSQNVMLIKFN